MLGQRNTLCSWVFLMEFIVSTALLVRVTGLPGAKEFYWERRIDMVYLCVWGDTL